jgi:hypothetical protein
MTNRTPDNSLHLKIAVAIGALLLLMLMMWTFPNAIVFMLVNLAGLFLFGFLTISILKG